MCDRRDGQPAAVPADAHGAAVDVAAHQLDAGDGARAEEARASPPSRRADGSRGVSVSVVGAARPRRRAAPQARGRRGRSARGTRVEAAHAAEPARERDLGQRQRRVVRASCLRDRQPARLRQLDGRDAERRVHRAPEVPRRHAELAGERLERALVERARLDAAPSPRPRGAARRRRGAEPRRQLGPAAEAGAEPVALRLRPRCRRTRQRSRPGVRAGQIGRQ